jgi:hypothetical protein
MGKDDIMTHKVLLFCLLAAFVLAGPIGCGSKVTKENLDQVTDGMTMEQVEKVLGGAGEKASAGASVGGLTVTGDVYTWKNGDKEINVVFKDGKVVGKSSKNL